MFLGGNNNFVEKTKVNSRKGNITKVEELRKRGYFGAVNRVNRKIFVTPVRLRNKLKLQNIIFRYIKVDKIIYWNCWKSYSDLEKYFTKHMTVNHLKKFVNTANNLLIHTNTIKKNWTGLRGNVPYRCKASSYIRLY